MRLQENGHGVHELADDPPVNDSPKVVTGAERIKEMETYIRQLTDQRSIALTHLALSTEREESLRAQLSALTDERDTAQARWGESERRADEATRDLDACREQVHTWERTEAHWKAEAQNNLLLTDEQRARRVLALEEKVSRYRDMLGLVDEETT